MDVTGHRHRHHRRRWRPLETVAVDQSSLLLLLVPPLLKMKMTLLLRMTRILDCQSGYRERRDCTRVDDTHSVACEAVAATTKSVDHQCSEYT